MYVITNRGIIALSGIHAADVTAVALTNALRQIADDVANLASGADDANALLQVTRDALSGNGIEAIKAIGAVSLSTAASAAILAGAATIGGVPVAGAVAISIAAGYAAGMLYEWAYDSAVGIGERAGQAAGEIDYARSVIDPATNNNFRQAQRPPPRDPLAIDLDGDGIETLGIPSNGAQPILFDHNADGVRTGTGWLRPDDAWLVLDRNGNGTIDSGRELFGVDTVITRTLTSPSGTYSFETTAATGFEALRSLDANGDRVLNAADAAFTQVLRVSADAVQDEQRGAVFLATLQMEQTHLNIDGKRIALAPGMNLSAEVKTGKRRVIDYLLAPVQAAAGESLRER